MGDLHLLTDDFSINNRNRDYFFGLGMVAVCGVYAATYGA